MGLTGFNRARRLVASVSPLPPKQEEAKVESVKPAETPSAEKTAEEPVAKPKAKATKKAVADVSKDSEEK